MMPLNMRRKRWCGWCASGARRGRWRASPQRWTRAATAAPPLAPQVDRREHATLLSLVVSTLQVDLRVV